MSSKIPLLSIPQVWGNLGFPPLLLTEILMNTVSNIIREKPRWWKKYKDPIISSKWKKEILEKTNIGHYTNFHPIDIDQIEYIFKELDWHAKRRQEQIDSGVTAPIEDAIDGVRRSDGLISLELKEGLLECVQKLKDIPEDQLDWHPGSNNQVLDLVHPSLYPVVVGVTRVMKNKALPPIDVMGLGDIVQETNGPNSRDPIYSSKKFQWLPTDVYFTYYGDYRSVKFKSYINNLHPEEHAEMYPVLEEILSKFIPMFEDVISDMRNIHKKKNRLTADPYNWYDAEPDHNGISERRNYLMSRIPRRVNIPEFEPKDEPERYHLTNCKKLQVIVKLADIVLTPDNPTYPGGTWHVEGMENENIVATGIYYYQSKNITESRLNFRINVHPPSYSQDDYRGCECMYGLPNQGYQCQYRGGVITKEDRCIVFPNIYQHQVQPFQLADPTIPGLRSILVFFLVNPEIPILSTTNVPPQQMSWLRSSGLEEQVAEELPLDFPISLEEAKRIRSELMMERKVIVDETNRSIVEREFSLCEH